MNARWPRDFYFRLIRRPQSKVQALVVRRKVTACGSRESSLSVHLYAGAKSVAVAAGAAQCDRQPVRLGARFSASVHEHLRMATKTGHDHVLPSVIIKITERSPASSCGRSSGFNALESAIVIDRKQRQFQIMQRRIDVLHIVEHMALRNEEILPSVIVKIFQPNAPAGASTRQRTQASFEAAIAER